MRPSSSHLLGRSRCFDKAHQVAKKLEALKVRPDLVDAGTAAVVATVSKIGYKGEDIHLNEDHCELTAFLKSTINGIRKGRIADTHHWIHPVKEEVLLS